MLSQPATKIFMKTAEPKAAEWISEGIGKVEIERLKETKFDGSRSGKNFTVDRQIEPLVMGSEISGLDDRHAYLKLGNNVARFDFDYLDLPTPTVGFVPRKSAVGEMGFNPDTLQPRRSQTPATEEAEPVPPSEAQAGHGAPLAHKRRPQPISWPQQNEHERLRNVSEDQVVDATTEPEMAVRQQIEVALPAHSEDQDNGVHHGIF
jgi:Type IV secretion-system coupling protein DNA-binding domain